MDPNQEGERTQPTPGTAPEMPQQSESVVDPFTDAGNPFEEEAAPSEPVMAAPEQPQAPQQPPVTPPPAPQQQYVPSYADNGVKAHGGMNWAVKLLFAVVALGVIGGVAWFTLGLDTNKTQDPDLLLVNAASQVITAQDVRAEITIPQKTLMALAGASAEEVLEMAKEMGVDAADFVATAEIAIVDAGNALPNQEYRLAVESVSQKIAVELLSRSVGKTMYAQIAQFSVPSVPIDLSAFLNKWVKIDLEALENMFIAMVPEEGKAAFVSPYEYITPDHGAYADALRGAYMEHKPFDLEVDTTRETEVVLYPTPSESFKPFVMAFVPQVGNMILADIDRAVTEQRAAGNKDSVDALNMLRDETATELDDLIAVLDKELDDLLRDDEETAFSELDLGDDQLDLLDDMKVGVALHADTGALKSLFVEFDTEEIALEPIMLEWKGVNTGYTIDHPEEFMTVEEVLPLVMGVVFGGLMQETMFVGDGLGEDVEVEDEMGDATEDEKVQDVEVSVGPGNVLMYEGISDEEAMRDDDGDGILNVEEYMYGTDPLNADTDGDGYSDLVELENGYDPLSAN